MRKMATELANIFEYFLEFPFFNFITLIFLQELTGKLPKEYPLDPGEEPPTVRRKIGTAFKLDEQKILPKGEVVVRFLVPLSSIFLYCPDPPLTKQA